MQKLLKFTLIIAGCALATNALADSRVDSVWKCELKEGKEIAAVQAANGEWLKHVNGAIDVGEITSATAEAIVGKQGYFSRLFGLHPLRDIFM